MGICFNISWVRFIFIDLFLNLICRIQEIKSATAEMKDSILNCLIFTKSRQNNFGFLHPQNLAALSKFTSNNFIHLSENAVCDVLNLEDKTDQDSYCVPAEFIVAILLLTTNPQENIVIWCPKIPTCYRMMQAAVVFG